MAPAPPTKEGYVFSGWYSDSELMNAYNFTTMMVTGDLTLYAKWTVYVPNHLHCKLSRVTADRWSQNRL